MQQELKKLHSKGLNDREIGDILEISSKKVWYERKKLKLPANAKPEGQIKYTKKLLLPLVEKGLSDAEIAEKFNTSDISIWSARKRLGIKVDNRSISKNQKITKRQHEILLGTILGDSTIYRDKNCINCRFTCSHSPEQEEYANWKLKELESIGAKKSYLIPNKKDSRTGKKYDYYRVFTGNNPELNIYREKFYKDGIKHIPISFLDDFSELSLAILFMDDGSRTVNTISIATCSFTKENLLEFTGFLKGRFNLNFTIHKNHSIYLRRKSFERFKKLVEPYLLDSMKYKIGSPA